MTILTALETRLGPWHYVIMAAVSYNIQVSQNPKLVGGVFMLVSLIMLGATLFLSHLNYLLTRVGQTTQGIVVEMVQIRDNDGSSMFRPMIEFTPGSLPAVRFTSNSSTKPPRYKVGDRVEVIYPPDDPASAQINTWFELWFAPTLTGAMGVIFAVLGYGLWAGKIKPTASIKR